MYVLGQSVVDRKSAPQHQTEVWIDNPVCRSRTPSYCRFSKEILDRTIMTSFGFSLCSRREDADIIIDRGAMTDDEVQAVLGARKRLVLLWRRDASYGGMPPWIDDPYLIGVFQEYVPRNLEAYLWPTFKNRFHTLIICKSHVFRSDPLCDRQERAKMSGLSQTINPNWAKKRQVNWNWEQYYMWWRTNPREKHREGVVMKAKRHFDVFLAVHLRSRGADPTSLARAAAVRALMEYSGRKAVFVCPEALVTKAMIGSLSIPQQSVRCLAEGDYKKHLLQSIAVVFRKGKA